MAKFAPTRDQQRAIEARNSALLVSAAAGSGKTKVLTERLMSYITADDPASIDSFLVITYTRAAAGELRSRVMEELTARMAEEPNNAALRRQYALLSRAQISTIHGFCGALIRDNCLPLELPPDFKVVDEPRSEAMKRVVLEKTLEDCYDRLEENKALAKLIDTIGAGRDDTRLGELILNLHKKMQSHPYPEVWAEKQKMALYAEGADDPGETVWGRFLLDTVADRAEFWARNMEELLGLMLLPEYAYIGKGYAASITETAESLRNFAAAAKLGWDKAAENSNIAFNRLGTVRKPAHPEVVQQIKDRREACKKAVKDLGKDFSQSGSEVLEDMHSVAPVMEALLDLTMEFDKAFAAEKKRRGLVDYSDLEHFAAKLLSDTEGNPSELAKQLSQKYTEIMVDEYQDVNEVQELIFRCLSKDENNLFMVGDVKQSIYRFRLADPTIFTDKYLEYADYERAKEGEPRRILLQENFRSRSQVLDAANAVFENIMSTQLGELEYDDDARLHCGNKSYVGDVPVPQIRLLAKAKAAADVEEAPAKSQETEAAYVAKTIREMVDGGLLVTQGDSQRPVRYGDIALLMRSANSVVNVYRKALMEQGIPVQSAQGGEFYSTAEIVVMMALLGVIDNPMQDVPLLTVLQSPYVGFTPDELAQIRACDKSVCFYDAMCIAAGDMPKAEAFLQKLDAWREISADIPLRELLWRVMDDLSVTAVTSAMADGQMRRRNLMAFVDLAAQFESNGYQGLRRFMVWLERQMESGIEPETYAGDGSNAVQIMSIHRSKGLEFPVVFLCDTARKFNKMDATATVLIHPQLGLGPKVIDTDRGIEYPSMPRLALAKKIELETLSEEMRLLYVAMTRAREYLYITSILSEPEKKVAKMEALVTSPVSPQILEEAGALIDWLIAAALADGQQHLKISYEQFEKNTGETAETAVEVAVKQADAELVERIRENLAYRYPYEASVTLPSKLTATELKHLYEGDQESVSIVSGGARRFRKFRTDGAAERLNAVEKGVATHLVFQHIDYRIVTDLESAEQEIQRLTQCGILTERQARGVDAVQVAGFFRSPAGELMRTGDAVLREFKFSLLRPASVYFAGADEDEVLLQGVIDCAVEKDGVYTIIDYKTDYVTEDTVDARAAVYASQVEAYKQAMEEMTGKPVAKTILYFLKPGISVEI